MKNMKRFFAMVLAVMMVLSMATVASADDATYSITINNSATGYTYEAYQIFTGDLAKESNPDETVSGTSAVLSNIKWGSGVTYTGEGVTVEGKSEKSMEAADIAAALANNSLTLDALLADLTLGTAAASTNIQTEGKYVLSGLTAGYYLVKNTVVPEDGAYTEYIVEVVENSTVTPKASVPSVEKKVKDTNDTDGTTTGWQDSADYDIGDSVPFQLTATLADNVAAYDTYKVVFHDTLSAGLTYKDDFKVMFGETEVTSYFTDSYDATTGTLTITCNNVKEFGATNNSVITVEYTATLNTNAVIGSAGNPNKVYLEYSNNPNWKPNGNPDTPDNPDTGKTPEDKVVVFTYKVVVNKVDENKAPLTGAGFTLYKWEVVTEATDTAAAVYDWVAVGNELKGEALTTFTWTGLDDGNYKLVETTTPAGYNTIDPIEFTISATHDVTSDDPKLTELTGGEKFTGEVSTGALTGEVVNQSGATLPETGGMGTTMFYIIGGVLVLAAVVLLVTKKRMAAAE